MSRELVITFFPVTFGELLKRHASGFFDYLFPDWVAERCPMPSVDIHVAGIGAVTVFWPVTALLIVAGFLSSWWLGLRTLRRVLRDGPQARQGLFLFSASLLWYGCMCIGALFFHCLHIYTIPHILDLAGTGLSSLSVIAGLAALTGAADDRTAKQRVGWLLVCVAFVAVAILSPTLLQEQLYMSPALLAVVVGARFIQKISAKLQGEAKWWLGGAVLGVTLALGSVPMDRSVCAAVGAEFALLFWFFLGSNLAILATHQFALVVADTNLHFTNVKTQ